jgi:hypothetical protein
MLVSFFMYVSLQYVENTGFQNMKKNNACGTLARI